MSNIPTHLKYTESHEWISIDDDGIAVIGITDHAQEALGDLVFVELPAVDDEVKQGDPCAVVESVKAASDIFAPVGGTVLEINSELDESPDKINSDPYGEGWICKISNVEDSEVNELMNAEQYAAFLNED